MAKNIIPPIHGIPVAQRISHDIARLAERIQQGPLFRPDEHPIVSAYSYLRTGQTQSKETFFGGVLKGTGFSFGIRLSNRREAEIELIREAMRIAPRYKSEKERTDEAFDNMVAEHYAMAA